MICPACHRHTNPLHHRMQLELIKAVDSMDERPLAIGLEMFYPQHQQALEVRHHSEADEIMASMVQVRSLAKSSQVEMRQKCHAKIRGVAIRRIAAVMTRLMRGRVGEVVQRWR